MDNKITNTSLNSEVLKQQLNHIEKSRLNHSENPTGVPLLDSKNATNSVEGKRDPIKSNTVSNNVVLKSNVINTTKTSGNNSSAVVLFTAEGRFVKEALENLKTISENNGSKITDAKALLYNFENNGISNEHYLRTAQNLVAVHSVISSAGDDEAYLKI